VNPKPGAWRTIVAGSAAVAAIVALVSFVIIPRLQSPIERAQTQEQGVPTVVPDLPASAPAAAEIGKAPDTHVDPSVNVAPVSMEPAKREDSAAGESEDKWRVVIYSYSHAIDAQRRVQLISADHPGVQAHVYSPNVNGPYLVVTGDAMSRAEANRMRDRVVELGMPESTRIESFKD
jgi:cell division protein FtsN